MTALVLLNACAVPIKEEDFYTDKGQNGAVLTHFFSTDIQDISKAAWDSMREGMTCLSAQGISDIKGEIEQLCTKTPCSEEVQKAKAQALVALDVIQKRALQTP